ncbi:MAG: YbhB/YbcL family Raf kinase inhibitor-like protein [Candidatus Omnitrophica bacterium]|nr:YbhB/YbcL family Raf kinase inhibitor-like protein [Candidatus Omnitrophota bacterium]
MELSSKAFYNNKVMSQRYTRFGANVNPPLTIKNIPEGTTSLALIVDDPDAPAKTWVHWVMFNIPVTDEIKERGTPGVQGKNDFGNNKYDGPQPPSGTHRYVFTLYALNTTLDLPEGTTKEELLAAMRGAILQKAQLIGLYGRKESDK